MLQRLWRHLADTLRHVYFHYSVILGIAILEPAERYVINSVVIVVVSLLVYATVVYMPGHVTMLYLQHQRVSMAPSLWKRLLDAVQYYYFQYTVTFTISMMEPIERWAFNVFFVFFTSLFMYTTLAYLPGHLTMMVHFLLHLAGIAPFPSDTNDTEYQAAAEGLS